MTEPMVEVVPESWCAFVSGVSTPTYVVYREESFFRFSAALALSSVSHKYLTADGPIVPPHTSKSRRSQRHRRLHPPFSDHIQLGPDGKRTMATTSLGETPFFKTKQRGGAAGHANGEEPI